MRYRCSVCLKLKDASCLFAFESVGLKLHSAGFLDVYMTGLFSATF